MCGKWHKLGLGNTCTLTLNVLQLHGCWHGTRKQKTKGCTVHSNAVARVAPSHQVPKPQFPQGDANGAQPPLNAQCAALQKQNTSLGNSRLLYGQ